MEIHGNPGKIKYLKLRTQQRALKQNSKHGLTENLSTEKYNRKQPRLKNEEKKGWKVQKRTWEAHRRIMKL